MFTWAKTVASCGCDYEERSEPKCFCYWTSVLVTAGLQPGVRRLGWESAPPYLWSSVLGSCSQGREGWSIDRWIGAVSAVMRLVWVKGLVKGSSHFVQARMTLQSTQEISISAQLAFDSKGVLDKLPDDIDVPACRIVIVFTGQRVNRQTVYTYIYTAYVVITFLSIMAAHCKTMRSTIWSASAEKKRFVGRFRALLPVC